MTKSASIRTGASIASAGVVLVIALMLLLAPSKASASTFCANVNLAPFGQGGDRCWGQAMNSGNWGEVRTTNRAGCVDIADTSNNLLTSWSCAPAGLGATVYVFANVGTWRKVVIRNNNTNNPGVFTGAQQCALGNC